MSKPDDEMVVPGDVDNKSECIGDDTNASVKALFRSSPHPQLTPPL